MSKALNMAFEVLTMRKWGTVIECQFLGDMNQVVAPSVSPSDPSLITCEPVVKELAMPNGIAVSRDGKHLYVAASASRQMLVYSRELLSNKGANKGIPSAKLDLVQTMDLDTSVDNIELEDSTGHLWVASHPSMLLYSKAMGDRNHRAPTSVMRIMRSAVADKSDMPPLLSHSTYYQDVSPKHMGASSTGAVFFPSKKQSNGNGDDQSTLLAVGGVFDPGFLVCKIDLAQNK